MKKWPAVLLSLVFSVSLVTPASAYQTEIPPITFHVVHISPEKEIADVEETLIWEGTGNAPPCYGSSCSSEVHFKNGTLALENLCEGIDCYAQDIYYKFEFAGTWSNRMTHQLPFIFFYHDDYEDITWTSCEGDPEQHYGDCKVTTKGMIKAEDIEPIGSETVHESFVFSIGMNEKPYEVPYMRMTTAAWTLTVSTKPIEDDDESCAGQFLQGNKLGTLTLSATASNGVRIDNTAGWPKPGGFVIIKVASGTWQNNGTGDELTSLAVSTHWVPFGATWSPLAGYQYTSCHTTSGMDTYYLQVSEGTANGGQYHLRVNDTDGNFASNTGTLTIELWSVSVYSPYPTGCDAIYRIGTQIETKSVSAIVSSGISMFTATNVYPKEEAPAGGEKEDLYLVLEINVGPHYDGVFYTYNSDIWTGSSWIADENIPGATCVVPLDNMGRIRVYFPYSPNLSNWKFRASDSQGEMYSNNTGYAGYTLSYADLLQVYPPGGPAQDCSQFSHDTSGTAMTIQASAETPQRLTTTGNQLYAIETSGGPWYDGAIISYSIAMTDNGNNYYTTYDYPYVLCASSETPNHSTIYFKALPGKTYRLRADDDNFSNNTGTEVATLYKAETSIDGWPDCSEYSIQSRINLAASDRKIPVYQANGVPVVTIETGKQYALVITDESQVTYLGVDMGYQTEISDDNGSTWTDFQDAPFKTCAIIVSDETTGDKVRYKIFFVADGNYKIRVDTLPIYRNLYSGYLMYDLYNARVPDDTPGPPGGDPYVPPEWGTTCYEPCNRPLQLIVWEEISFWTLGTITFPLPDVGGWLEYARCAIQKFLSWCPDHTTALGSISDMFSEREPFGTVIELQDSVEVIQEQADFLNDKGGGENGVEDFTPYSIIGDVGGGELGSSDWTGFLQSVENTPWDGSPLDLSNVDTSFGGDPNKTAYYNYCVPIVEPIIGDMVFVICESISTFKSVGNFFMIAFQFTFDIVVIYLFVKYLRKRWLDGLGGGSND